MRPEGAEGSRAGYIGELRHRGGLRVVLSPNRCGCSSAECWRGVRLQPEHQGPVV